MMEAINMRCGCAVEVQAVGTFQFICCRLHGGPKITEAAVQSTTAIARSVDTVEQRHRVSAKMHCHDIRHVLAKVASHLNDGTLDRVAADICKCEEERST